MHRLGRRHLHGLVLALAGILLAGPALAHTGVGEASGFLAGIWHPAHGLDHLVAMLAVGLWSGFALPRRFWLGPACFMTAMAAGAVLGFGGIGLPLVETAIAASVLLFGLLTLFARPDQGSAVTGMSLAAIGLFALFHGQDHAAEATGNSVTYLLGFLLATGALHLAGIGIARGAATRALAQRAMGTAIVASGLVMVLS